MKKDYYIYFLLFLLEGCSSIYIPSPKNVPLFEKKGEVQIEAGASTNSVFATGSYAFSDKYALITNGSLSFRNISRTYDLGSTLFNAYFEGSGAHRSIEMGLGRYNLLPSSNRRLEVFVGAGYGNTGFDSKDYQSQYIQGFVQANAGRKFKYFEIGWSFHMTYAHFYCKYPEYISQPEIMQSRKEIVYTDFGTINPGGLIVLRFGGNQLKAFVRSGLDLSFPLSSSLIKTTGMDRNYTAGHFSIGISYRF